MDKYLTFPGKQPVFLGDIDFMQDAVSDAFAQLLKGYTGLDSPTAILHGIVTSEGSGVFSWTAGVVCLAGEILPVPSGSISGGNGGPYYFSIVTEHSGEREMGDGIIRPVLQSRHAEITETSSDYPMAGMIRINPVDIYSPGVYDFTGFSNSADYYAHLANCAGALHIALRQPGQAEADQTLFTGEVVGLPEALLSKLGASGNPHSMVTRANVAVGSSVNVTVSWSVGRGKVVFTITLPEGITQIISAWEVRDLIPIF